MAGGKQVKAIKVFAHAIRYLKDHMLNTLEQRGAGIKAKDINWVLTVPAIWEDPAKQFMREAAEEVNMHDFYQYSAIFLISLEPTLDQSEKHSINALLLIYHYDIPKTSYFFFLYNRQE